MTPTTLHTWTLRAKYGEHETYTVKAPTRDDAETQIQSVIGRRELTLVSAKIERATDTRDAVDVAADALHDAVLTVANAVSSNEDELRAFMVAIPGRTCDARESVREILEALDAWKKASNSAHSAIVENSRAKAKV